MAPTEDVVEVVRTNDLALATSLRLEGYEPVRLEMNGEGAEWLFLVQGEIQSIIHEYASGDLVVEPREYNKVLRETRRDLFNFLNANGIQPKPSPQTRKPRRH